MEIINKLGIFLNIIFIISLMASFFIAKKIKSNVNSDKVQEPLTANEKVIIWVTCLGSPLFAGLIYYYGWRKILPLKVKQANNISWLALLILAFFWFIVSALIETR